MAEDPGDLTEMQLDSIVELAQHAEQLDEDVAADVKLPVAIARALVAEIRRRREPPRCRRCIMRWDECGCAGGPRG